MAEVLLSTLADALGGPVVADATFTATATRARAVGDGVVANKTITVPVVQGVPSEPILLDQSGVDWCWRVRVVFPSIGVRIDRTVAVPDVPSVEWADLVDVDPATLLPSEGAVPAWTAAVGQVAEILADTVVARDAATTAQGLSEDARDAAVLARGIAEGARDGAVLAKGASEAARDQAQVYAANTVELQDTTFTALIADEDSATRTQLNATIADAAISPTRIPDMVNSWWAYPDCAYDPIRKRIFITGATRGGAVKVGWFDLLSKTVGEKVISKERHVADDHYTRSMLIREGKQPVIVGAYHDRDKILRTVRGLSYGEFDMLEPENNTTLEELAAVAYGQIIGPNPQNVDAGLATFFRGGDAANYMMRSTDYGATWTTPQKFHDKAYILHRRNGNIGHFLSVDHPTDATPRVRYFKWSLSNTGGSPKTAAGAGILGAGVTGTSIWDYVAPDASTALVGAGTDVVRTAPTGTSQRVFDMTRNARQILIGTYADKASLQSGVTYKVLVRQAADTSNTWSEETLTESGPAFGPSGYVGGACFAEDGSVLLIVNRAGGTKTLERWVRAGSDFAAGTWALDRVIYTAPAGVTALGRPRTPIDCNNLNALVPGIVTFGEYHYYDPSSFLNFYGDQLLIEF